MAVPAHLQVTWPDLQKLRDDGKRRELIEGERYVWTSPISSTKGFRETSSPGRHLPEGAPDREEHRRSPRCRPVTHRRRRAGPLYVSHERSTIFAEDDVQGMPDLLVEIVSDTTRRMDEIVKCLSSASACGSTGSSTQSSMPSRSIAGPTSSSPSRTELSAAAGDRLTTRLLPGLEISLPESSSNRSGAGWRPLARLRTPFSVLPGGWWPGQRLALAGGCSRSWVTRTVSMARTADGRLTSDDLLALPDDGLRHELIDGSTPWRRRPNLKHQVVVGEALTVASDRSSSVTTRPSVPRRRYDVVFSPTRTSSNLISSSSRAERSGRRDRGRTSRARPTWSSRSSRPRPARAVIRRQPSLYDRMSMLKRVLAGWRTSFGTGVEVLPPHRRRPGKHSGTLRRIRPTSCTTPLLARSRNCPHPNLVVGTKTLATRHGSEPRQARATRPPRQAVFPRSAGVSEQANNGRGHTHTNSKRARRRQ